MNAHTHTYEKGCKGWEPTLTGSSETPEVTLSDPPLTPPRRRRKAVKLGSFDFREERDILPPYPGSLDKRFAHCDSLEPTAQ